MNTTTGRNTPSSTIAQAGHEVILQCEVDPGAQQVLRNHWPSVLLIPDVAAIPSLPPVRTPSSTYCVLMPVDKNDSYVSSDKLYQPCRRVSTGDGAPRRRLPLHRRQPSGVEAGPAGTGSANLVRCFDAFWGACFSPCFTMAGSTHVHSQCVPFDCSAPPPTPNPTPTEHPPCVTCLSAVGACQGRPPSHPLGASRKCVPCAMYNVPCAMCHVQCAMCHVQCAMCHAYMRHARRMHACLPIPTNPS